MHFSVGFYQLAYSPSRLKRFGFVMGPLHDCRGVLGHVEEYERPLLGAHSKPTANYISHYSHYNKQSDKLVAKGRGNYTKRARHLAFVLFINLTNNKMIS